MTFFLKEHMLKFYLTFFLDLSGIYSEFLSGTLSGIYFGIYSGVLSGRIWVFWHVPSLISRGALGPSIPQWRLAERGTLPALPDLFQHRRRSSGWLGVRPAKRGKLGWTKMGTSHHNFPQLLACDLPSFTYILLEQARSLGKWNSSQQYIF